MFNLHLVDWAKAWGDKVAYRVLQVIGTKPEVLEKYVQAVQNKNNETIAADQELSATHGKAILIKVIIAAVIAFAAFKLYQKYRRKR